MTFYGQESKPQDLEPLITWLVFVADGKEPKRVTGTDVNFYSSGYVVFTNENMTPAAVVTAVFRPHLVRQIEPPITEGRTEQHADSD